MNRYAYYIGSDAFGYDLPVNWIDIAESLNQKIDAMIDALGINAEYGPIDSDVEAELSERIEKLWTDYINGKLPDVPDAIYED